MSRQEIPAMEPAMEENKVDKVMEYILNTPENTNPAILKSMLEDLSSEGGGGSSDFSTAQVTIVTGSQNENGGHIESVVLIQNDELLVGTLTPDNPRTVTAVLYKGKQFLEANRSKIESVSGNIEFDETYECYVITGDCTITIYQNIIG